MFLNFHGVGEPPPGKDSAELDFWWDERPFLWALDAIAEQNGDLPATVLVTFDDGNASDVEIALPALVKRGMTASFFVCAGRIGSRDYVDGSAIRQLLSAGMKVGSHGMNHVDWRRVGDAELHVEIADARRKLEDICGCTIDEAAIPFGSYDSRVLTKLKVEGFRPVYTSGGGTVSSNAWLKPRNTLNRAWQWRDLLAELSARQSNLANARRAIVESYKALR